MKDTKRIATNDRQMSTKDGDGSEVFFFPKHNPPISVRAASREEAERILKANNEQEA